MKILLTGGSGDVGTLLTRALLQDGHEVVNIDMAPPKTPGGIFMQGSILDRALLEKAMAGVDCVVHIAAWHGIHAETKTPAEFHDLNVTGTFNVFQAAADAGVGKCVFVSSTSAAHPHEIYGHTKILGEKMAETYAHRHGMEVVTLRPRAFIPSWNRDVYADYVGWAKWFMRGAVHIDDFRDAVLLAINLKTGRKAPVYTIDGAYDYSAGDLKNWDKDGPGTTFAKYYPDHVALAQKYGLDTALKPKVLEIEKDAKLPGYAPRYTMRSLLEELKAFGADGPPAPYAAANKTPAPRRKNSRHP